MNETLRSPRTTVDEFYKYKSTSELLEAKFRPLKTSQETRPMTNQHIYTMLHIENGAQTIAIQVERSEHYPNAKRWTYLVDAEVHKTLTVGSYMLIPGGHEKAMPRVVEVAEVHKAPKIDWNATCDYQWAAPLDQPHFFNKVADREAELSEAIARAEARKQLQAALGELDIDTKALLLDRTDTD